MPKITHNKKTRIFIIMLIAILLCGAVVLSVISSGPVSREDASTKCQKLYDEMTTDISAVQGYNVLSTKHSCSPTSPDEMGNTDYDFNAVYRLSKPGNDTASGIKANMESLTKQLPRKYFTVQATNDYSAGGQPDTICVSATTLIQGEYDEIYNSYPERQSDYRESGSYPEYDPCQGLP